MVCLFCSPISKTDGYFLPLFTDFLLGDDAKPIYSFFKSIDQILHWEQWTTSLACFLVGG